MRSSNFILVGLLAALLLSRTPSELIWLSGIGFFAQQDVRALTVNRWAYDGWLAVLLTVSTINWPILMIGFPLVIMVDFLALPFGSADSLALLTLYATMTLPAASFIVLAAALLGIGYGLLVRVRTIAFLPFLLLGSCFVLPFVAPIV